MFDEKTQQKLKYYVYLLVDERTMQPFYVGKGKNNRVFDHLACALETNNVSDKYETIRAIQNAGNQVLHLIVRHGLNEKTAFEIEASLIDMLDFLQFGLTNRVGGQKSIEKGLMRSGEIKRLYNAEKLNSIESNCLIININRKYQRGAGKEAIYWATKETWTIDKRKLTKIEYVLSEYRGLIVEVFKVMKWYPKERGYTPRSKKYGQKKIGYGFDGEVAEDTVRNRYINKSIAHIKKRGAATAIRYRL